MGFTPPALDEVLELFKSENQPEIEARRFFNHFQSNGWKVGGKTSMKDWKAAARNWMLNIKKFNQPKPSPNQIINPNKSYDIPL